jgi:hypothetical protein
MAESPMVTRPDLDSKQSWSETAIAPSYELRLRWMSTRWKGNFINFSIESYLGICSVMYTGENPWGRGSSKTMKESGDEDDNNEEKFGQCFHQTTHEQIQRLRTKQRPLEHRQMKTHVGDIRCKEMFGANHEGVHTKDNIQWRRHFGLPHEGLWSYMKTLKSCVSPQMNRSDPT